MKGVRVRLGSLGLGISLFWIIVGAIASGPAAGLAQVPVETSVPRDVVVIEAGDRSYVIEVWAPSNQVGSTLTVIATLASIDPGPDVGFPSERVMVSGPRVPLEVLAFEPTSNGGYVAGFTLPDVGRYAVRVDEMTIFELDVVAVSVVPSGLDIALYGGLLVFAAVAGFVVWERWKGPRRSPEGDALRPSSSAGAQDSWWAG